MIARFKVRLREHADFADRRLVHQRADVAGHLLIAMNQLATHCIAEANSLGRAEFVACPRTDTAQAPAGTGLAARQGSDAPTLPRGHRVAWGPLAAVTTDLFLAH